MSGLLIEPEDIPDIMASFERRPPVEDNTSLYLYALSGGLIVVALLVALWRPKMLGRAPRTAISVACAVVAFGLSVAWVQFIPIEPPTDSSIAGIMAQFTTERYAPAAILYVAGMLLLQRWTLASNILLFALMGGIAVLVLSFLALVAMMFSGPVSDDAAELLASFIVLMCLVGAAFASTLFQPYSTRLTSSDRQAP